MLTTKELCEVTNLWGHESLRLEMANGWVVELERHTSSDRTHFSVFIWTTPDRERRGSGQWEFYDTLTATKVDAHLARMGGVINILNIEPFDDGE